MSLTDTANTMRTGSITVSNPAVAQNIVLGWNPRYIRAYNVNNLTSYEWFYGMSDGTSLDNANHADTQWSVNAAGSISMYAGRVAGAAVTGTVSVTAGSATVTGSGTNFVGELAVGDKIVINGENRIVASIASSTSLVADTAFVATASTKQLFDVYGKGLGFTLGTDILDTAADVVRWVAFR